MASTLEKLIRSWIPEDIPDKVQDTVQDKRKEAKAQIRETRKEAKAQIREMRKEAKSQIRDKRRALRRERPSRGRSLSGLLLGLLGGALLMYFLDPRGGGRRRAVVRDQVAHLRREGAGALGGAGGAASHVTDRARGAVAETHGRISEHMSDEAIPDQQLEARVRSELGRSVRHLSAVDIRAHEGAVTIGGSALVGEVEDLIKAARGVRGVKSIENRLTVFERPEDIPALQG